MTPIKTILVALDFSEFSQETLEYAAYLAGSTGAGLIAINVLNQRDVDALKHLQVYPGEAKDVDDYISRRFESRAAQLDNCAQQAACGLPIESRMFKVGVPASEILGAIDETGADLVVMGARGKTNLTDQIFGSCARRVLKRSPVPVLALRSAAN